jgi:hypothetical protein
VLVIGAAATFAPYCFAAGVAWAVLKGRVRQVLTRDTPRRERPSTTYLNALEEYVVEPKKRQISFFRAGTSNAYWREKIPGYFLWNAPAAGYGYAVEAARIGNEVYLWKQEKAH